MRRPARGRLRHRHGRGAGGRMNWGLSVLIVEKSSVCRRVDRPVGRRAVAARQPGARGEPDAGDTVERAATYLSRWSRIGARAAVGSVPGSTCPRRWTCCAARRRCGCFGPATTPTTTPKQPGGSAAGRTCECQPFDTSVLGEYRTRLRPGVMEAAIPMPTTGADYRWMNLVARVPRKGLPVYRQASGAGRGRPAGGPALRRGRAGH